MPRDSEQAVGETVKKTKMETDKLALWSAVEKTDPKFTKEFNRSGGFKGTAINPTWLAKRATETFGPIGIGWGYAIQDESYQKGHDFINENGQVLGSVVIHKLRLEVWYIWNGSLGRVQQFGQTEFVGRNKYGLFTDEEAPKKSLTDALSKCLSLIGFAADVHMGLFDDNKYVNTRRDEEANGNGHKDKPPKNPPGITKFRQESREFYRELYACTDYDQYVAFVKSAPAKAFIEKALKDFPSDWDGDGGDVAGIRKDMEAFCARLKATPLAAE